MFFISNVLLSARETGISLIEIAISIAVAGILAAFALTSFGDITENAGAELVTMTQTQLQNTITQAADRLDINPSQFNPGTSAINADRVINALPDVDNPNEFDYDLVRDGANYLLQLGVNGGGIAYTARYDVNGCGQVCLVSITGFTRHSVNAGDLSCGGTSTCRQIQRN